LFRWRPDGLLVANTGHPLTGVGVLSLSTLRASAKAADARSVGRFGVGFAAVLAVTDEPEIHSSGGPSIRWSAPATAGVVAELPSLARDLAARGGHVPVLRLPFSAPPRDIPAGYDTAVWLPWRDAGAADLAARLLADVDPTLLLGLPGLAELLVEVPIGDRRWTCRWDGPDATLDGRRWLGAAIRGEVPRDVAQPRPAEELTETSYEVRVYVPSDGASLPIGVARVLRAPTITDEPVDLPAVVFASVPLEPTRRRILRGPTSDLILAAAGRCLAGLAVRTDDPLALVPVGFPGGDVDAAIREAALAAFRSIPLVDGLPPDRCSYLDLGDASGPIADLLGGRVAGLLPAQWTWAAHLPALAALEVRRIDTAAAIALLAARSTEPDFWRQAYGALERAPDREALGALPVPLLDGRIVTGARGALLPQGAIPAGLEALPVRLVHPAAAHPLLERLGARTASAAGLLADPAVRQAVEASADDEAPLALSRAVAALVAEAGAGINEHPWLAAVALPAAGGGFEAAADLVWPDSAMESLLDPEAGFRRLDPPVWLDRRIAGSLGVADLPVVHRFVDVSLPLEPDSPLADIDGIEDWAEDLLAFLDRPEVHLPEIAVIHDLDAIADVAGLLGLARQEPDLRQAIVAPVRIGKLEFRSYAAWWLSTQPVLGGLRPIDCRLPDESLLSGLYEPAPADIDSELLAALGVRRGIADVLTTAADLDDLLARLGDSRRSPATEDVAALHAAIADAWADRLDDAPPPPVAVRAIGPDGRVAAYPAEECVAVDSPDVIPLLRQAGRAALLAGVADASVLANLLDIELASDLSWPMPAPGVRSPVPQVLRSILSSAPATYQAIAEGPAPWRYVDGTLFATAAGLAPGVAWAAGRWERRHLLRVALETPHDLPAATLEELSDPGRYRSGRGLAQG